MKRDILIPEAEHLIKIGSSQKKLRRIRKKQAKKERQILTFEVVIYVGGFMAICYFFALAIHKAFF